MKKLLSLMLSALCLLTAASAFAQESAPETVVIQALNGNRESAWILRSCKSKESP